MMGYIGPSFGQVVAVLSAAGAVLLAAGIGIGFIIWG
jgi:hypothetical protein